MNGMKAVSWGSLSLAPSLVPSLVMVLASACGGADGPGTTDPDANLSGLADAAPDPDSATPPSACQSAAQALAQELYQNLGGCTVVVRLAYESRAPLGYQIACGPYRGADEITARATAQADTGYGDSATMLNPINPEDAYVFHEPATQAGGVGGGVGGVGGVGGGVGGVGVVSADTGLSVFGGTIVWDGNGVGDIVWPSEWRPAADLASMCAPSGGVPSARGYDLETGGGLAMVTVDELVDVIEQTAIPEALWRGGYVFDAVVLLYPRKVGGAALDPATTEWIVVVNGGWLE